MSKGKVVPLTNGRRLVDDVIRIARSQPIASFYRDVDLTAIDKLRKQIKPRISWNAILMKAYSMVSHEVPELRQYYRKFPSPHLYQVEETVAQLTMAREENGETRLYFARFRNPQDLTLHQIQAKIDYFQTAPIAEVKQFRHQDRFAALPGMLRRFLWWMLMEVWPTQRPTYMGTFGMTLSCFNQTFAASLLSPNTTSLGVDPTPRSGVSRVLLTFDHRVLDGKPVIDIISKLYSALVGPVQREMEELAATAQKASSSDSAAA
jgi:hypothetical protein